MVKNILVTGASGYIGCNLVKGLLSRGYKVGILIRKTTDTASLAGYLDQVDVFCMGDSIEALSDYLCKNKYECVIHLATFYRAEHTERDLEDMLESNICFGAELLEAMKLSGIKKIIYTRTGWQHYMDAPYNPVNFYAATKQAFEDIMKYYTEAEGFSSVTLEIYDTYGENDFRNKLIEQLKKHAEDGITMQMSPGLQKVDYVYIEDVVNAFYTAISIIETMGSGALEYALSSDICYTLKEVVSIFEEAYHCRLQINWGSRKYRNREVFMPYRKLPRLQEWHADYDLRSGLEHMRDKEKRH